MGCRKARVSTELIRVLNDNGEPRIGASSSDGRGAWVCPNAACVTNAGERRAFSRAFRAKLADPYFADTLLGWLTEQEQSPNP